MDVVALTAAAIGGALEHCAVDGAIKLSDMRRVLDEIVRPDGEIAHILENQPPKCARFIVGQTGSITMDKRSDPFHRLMTWPFEHLLSGRPPVYPRTFLPHYFKILDCSGNEWLNRTRYVCMTLHRTFSNEMGRHFEWEKFFADQRVRHVAVHSLRHLMTFLDEPEGQWLWEHVMLEPDHKGAIPSKEQSEQLLKSLNGTWRMLEAEVAATVRKEVS